MTWIQNWSTFIIRSELTEFGHGRKVFALKFHPFDDNVFITGGWDKCIKVRYRVSLPETRAVFEIAISVSSNRDVTRNDVTQNIF